MDPTRVLVVFYSRCGTTEKLALAAAVGAVQARANIRLRRLPDSAASSSAAETPECQQELIRMRKEYIGPKEADLLWAQGIISILPPDLITTAPECIEYFDLLKRLGINAPPAALADAGQAVAFGRKLASSLFSA